MADLGKLLLVIGLVTAAAGALLLVCGRVPWLGRLPGDILVRRDSFTFYWPITTSILVSVILSLVLYFLRR
jgi:hypothetical protein